MTLYSMPFWIMISLCGLMSAVTPSSGQIIQLFIVAVFSGIITIILFFKVIDLVNHNSHSTPKYVLNNFKNH